MELVRITGLPSDPLDAAAAFHANWPDRLRAAEADLLLAFPLADHTHRGWRLAAVEMLARALAPHRVNAVTGDSETALAAAAAFLVRAPGVTGQLLALDGLGAAPVLPPVI